MNGFNDFHCSVQVFLREVNLLACEALIADDLLRLILPCIERVGLMIFQGVWSQLVNLDVPIVVWLGRVSSRPLTEIRLYCRVA